MCSAAKRAAGYAKISHSPGDARISEPFMQGKKDRNLMTLLRCEHTVEFALSEFSILP